MSLTEKVFVVAEVRAKDGFIEEVKRECSALVEPSRAEKGCNTYDLHQSLHDAALFVFVESWENMKDLENHLESPHSTAFDENTAGMLTGPEKITFLKRII